MTKWIDVQATRLTQQNYWYKAAMWTYYVMYVLAFTATLSVLWSFEVRYGWGSTGDPTTDIPKMNRWEAANQVIVIVSLVATVFGMLAVHAFHMSLVRKQEPGKSGGGPILTPTELLVEAVADSTRLATNITPIGEPPSDVLREVGVPPGLGRGGGRETRLVSNAY